ncbi:Uncharacterised protein [BD1-7 clade bacterium]|uniref:DUF6868 domain-containing protein n=1 Tax=BD1-7 clade bacterium TaxID=2029982 RepID=A0A5S9QZP8_9GAMM|nr:Uncharacterised protein [BD1-7 clade bacterium]
MSSLTTSALMQFFGWATLINFLILAVATLSIVLMRDTMIEIHSKMFGIEKSQLPAMYFRYLANYKIATVVFCFVPWLSLTIIS